MTELETMIARQPDAIEQLAELDVSAAVERLRSAPRIRLVGTGTSQHAAELGAWLLRSRGISARACAAADAARWDAPADDEGLIVISHTGATAFALRCRAAAQRTGQPLVSITGPAGGWPEALATPVEEASETYTVSYLGALAVLARLAHQLGGAAEGDPDALRSVAARLRATLAEPRIDEIGLPARALAIVGAGPWAVSAREGALKIREAARVLCEGFDAERLLHGAAVPYGSADGLILLEPDADPDGLVAAVGAAAREERIPVGTLSAAGDDPDSPFLAQFALTVRLQLLALRVASVRRTDPDVAIVGAWGREPLWALGAP